MTVLTRFWRLAGAVCAASFVLGGTAGAARPPVRLGLDSPFGSYLAARQAGNQRDAKAAATYYRQALHADPSNADLLERTFVAVLAAGEIGQAADLADRSIHLDEDARLARLVLGVRALKHHHYRTAHAELLKAIHGPITDLAPTLLAAWAQYGRGHWRSAIATLDKLKGPDWYQLFKDFHAGLILDLAGREKEAGQRFAAAYKLDPTLLRLVEAYGSWASRNDKPLAKKIYADFDKVVPQHPLIMAAELRLKHGHAVPQIVHSSIGGSAEALYGIGASFGRRGGEDLGLIYLQLAVYLEPRHAMALLSLGDLYESLKKPELALQEYAKVPKSSPLHRNAEIQLAIDLDSVDKTAEAQKRLHKLIAEQPDDRDAIMALGNILRERKDFSQCAKIYGRAIGLIKKPEKSDWTIYYFRGICYERSHQWPKAEADLEEALKLYPDQPHVLNYLGYSWIDKGTHLEEGMKMIRKAVQQRPDDGYIIDSLGWADYRLGNYKEAVKNLERAVSIQPADPTINDHLGDAYWRVGRKLEATFQWAHARDFKPDPKELATIEKKLKEGLPPVGHSSLPSAQADKAKKSDTGG